MPLVGNTRDLAGSRELDPPAYVALGMVRLGARSGYEIKRAVELSIRFFWTISQAQIYPSLRRLERAGLVRGRSEPRGKRPRRVYEITAEGEASLSEWLRRREPMPFELRDIGLAKLFFADALDGAAALALLAGVRARSEQRVAALREIEPAARLGEEQGNAYPLLTLRMGIGVHQAMVDVCREFELKLGDPERATGRAASGAR
jgi:DNA-binding PadR family transcriptional regulator